jgi:tryptophanyl-tRNA synthetase
MASVDLHARAEQNRKPVVFSGIQPSGNLHIGNYIGAIKQWVDNQESKVNYFCVVDLHAITVPQDSKTLKHKIRELVALYIACGIDPRKSVIFVQSHNSHHAELAWILNCFTGMGQLERMTQYKDKAIKQKEPVSVGLFNYPVLMAADILLYQTDEVPVGDDQKQHVELTRDIAERFNSRYGQDLFKIPRAIIGSDQGDSSSLPLQGGGKPSSGTRIMSLQNPDSKMSKSDDNINGTIYLLDNPDTAANKIKRAVTDSGSEIIFHEHKPAISNLLRIYSQLYRKPISELEQAYAGHGYGKFKQDLTEVVIETLKPIQEKYQNIINSGEIDQILDSGMRQASQTSIITLRRVMEVVGLG